MPISLRGDPAFPSKPTSTYPPFYRWCDSNRRLIVKVPEDAETIPDFTGELLEVRELTIKGGGNNLKSLPHSLATILCLQSLSFHEFAGLELHLPNLAGLVSLKTLRFEQCNIKSVPDTITGLPNLEELHVAGCCGVEALPVNLNGLVSLRKLFLLNNSNIKSVTDTITGLTNLEVLHIGGCRGLETLPKNWGGLVCLKRHFICNNTNIQCLPETITGLTNLEELHIVGCSGMEALPANLDGLVNLERLSILNNINIKSLPDTITGLSKLEYLQIGGCNGLEALPANLNRLVSLKSLLICVNTNIRSLPDSITGLTNLEELNILWCTSLEELPAKLDGLINLKKLYIWSNTNIKSLPESITTLQNLETLDISGCYSIKELPANLNNLPKLHITFPRPGEVLANYVAVPPPEHETLNLDGKIVCSDTEVTSAPTDEGIASYVEVLRPPPWLETLDEHGMVQFDGHKRAPASSSEKERDSFDSRYSHHADNGKTLDKTSGEKHGKRKRPAFQENQPQNMMLVDTTLELGAGWSTPEPFKRHRSVSEEKSHSSSSCASNSSTPKLVTLVSDIGNPEFVQECLNQHGWSGRSPATYLNMNQLPPNTSTRAVKVTTKANPNQVCSYGSGVGPSHFVVKGMYKEEVFRLEFSCTPHFEELKEAVGKKLELESSKYRMKFKNEDDDWVLMKDDSDLKYCLRVSNLSDTSITRLKVVDL